MGLRKSLAQVSILTLCPIYVKDKFGVKSKRQVKTQALNTDRHSKSQNVLVAAASALAANSCQQLRRLQSSTWLPKPKCARARPRKAKYSRPEARLGCRRQTAQKAARHFVKAQPCQLAHLQIGMTDAP